jgi:hypothetical protein
LAKPDLVQPRPRAFQKYIPVIRQIAESGWQPLTLATTTETNLLLERFGPDAAGNAFYTVLNNSSAEKSGELQVAGVPTSSTTNRAAVDLLTGQRCHGRARDGA